MNSKAFRNALAVAAPLLVTGALTVAASTQTPAQESHEAARETKQEAKEATREGRQETREASQETREAARGAGTAIRDSWITLKVHSQFIPEDALEDSDIDVDTNAGVVTLTGTVASEAGKMRAVNIAKTTEGVKNVNDRLRVVPAAERTAEAREAGREAGREAREAAGTTGRAVSDGWITSSIAAKIVAEDSLENDDIDIDVENGAVTLNGTVATDAAKNRAEAIAKQADGVRSVKNNLKVSSK